MATVPNCVNIYVSFLVFRISKDIIHSFYGTQKINDDLQWLLLSILYVREGFTNVCAATTSTLQQLMQECEISLNLHLPFVGYKLGMHSHNFILNPLLLFPIYHSSQIKTNT